MPIEKIAENLTRYTVSETLGTGLQDRLAGMSPLEYRVCGKNEQEFALVEEIPQGESGALGYKTHIYNVAGPSI